MSLIEPPHARRGISRKPLALIRLYRHAGMVSVVTTHGCKFHCPYCPIPAYNQFTFRFKSPQRLREDFEAIGNATGIDKYFGTDDNFFNNRETVDETFTELARPNARQTFRDKLFFAPRRRSSTFIRQRPAADLPRRRLAAIWFGIEDMTPSW